MPAVLLPKSWRSETSPDTDNIPWRAKPPSSLVENHSYKDLKVQISRFSLEGVANPRCWIEGTGYDNSMEARKNGKGVSWRVFCSGVYRSPLPQLLFHEASPLPWRQDHLLRPHTHASTVAPYHQCSGTFLSVFLNSARYLAQSMSSKKHLLNKDMNKES